MKKGERRRRELPERLPVKGRDRAGEDRPVRIRTIRTTRRARQNEETPRLPLRRGCDRHEPISEGGLACGIQGGPGRREKSWKRNERKKGEKSVYLELRFEELREEVLRRNHELREKPLR